MKSASLKIIFILVVIATTVLSCKKIDGPVPSTRDLLTAKTWTMTSYQNYPVGFPTIPSACSGFVIQCANSGMSYRGNGCSPLAYAGTWSISDQTVILFSGSAIMTVTSISTTNMTANLSIGSSTYVVQFVGN